MRTGQAPPGGPQDAPALAVQDMDVPFGQAPGLGRLTFDVASGERFVILGPSGAGKTTILRAIAGLTPMTGGRVEVSGLDVTTLPAESRDVVYLHQAPLLFPHLTVFENVAFPLRVRRRPQSEIADRVTEMLAAVRLGGFGGRAPRTLSGGQRHRVALARAIVSRPTLLLLDEPLSSLDPSLREEVREALVALQHLYRPALVLVTHDFDEAALMADRIAVLLDRALVQVATPGEVFRHPRGLAVARFLGFPNELPGEVDADGMFCSVLGRLPLERLIAPGKALAVFRPDGLRVSPVGLPMRVTAVRHRAQRTTITGEIQVGDTMTPLEVQVDGAAAPSMGAVVNVVAVPGAITAFPDPASRG